MGPTLRLRLAALAAALVALGCSARVDAPLETSSLSANSLSGTLVDAKVVDKEVGLVDLLPGRVTRVEGEFRMRALPTGGPAGAWESIPTGFQGTMQQEDGTPVPGGPSYRIEHTVELSDPATVINIDLWRQDRSGLFLYQEDVAAPGTIMARAAARTGGTDRAVMRALASIEQKREALRGALADMPTLRAGAAGGVGPHEITFLLYPLHPNATWDGRPGFNVWTVEAKEWLDTPAGRFHAARMNIVLPQYFGPDDSAVTWWAEPGEIQRHYHLFGDLTNDTGEVIGRFETDETFTLTSYTPGS